MTIRHLQIFIAVADTGKMKAAADQLFISQPSVSQAIRELEEYYDVRLFERLNQRIYITESGKKLLPYARHIIASINECKQVMSEEKVHQLLRVGCSVSVGTALLDNYLKGYEKLNDTVDIRVNVNNTTVIESQILLDRLDLGIVEGNVESEELKQIVIGEDELFLAIGKTHPFYINSKIKIEQLEGEALISREEGSVDRNQFELFLKEQNINMQKKWTCTNVQAIINAVAAGYGIGILSSLLIEKELKDNTIKILDIDGVHINRKIKLIYHKNKYLTDAMNNFINVCQINL